MKLDHEAFSKLTEEVKKIYERIRLQCIEQTNSFAYRIYIIYDVMDVDIVNDEINAIIRRYQRLWPYEALGIEDSEMHAELKMKAAPSSDQILKNLARLEGSGTMTEEQRRRARIAQKKKIQKGLTEFQI